jgi:hypothetical protein
MSKAAHIIGAGLSGLAAAVRLVDAGFAVHVHEATRQAGGRCRSYFDEKLGIVIDNGNHLILSGNDLVADYTKAIGSYSALIGPHRGEFPFVDIKSGKCWRLDLGDERFPTWLFDKNRRVPRSAICDYLAFLPLVVSASDKQVTQAVRCNASSIIA